MSTGISHDMPPNGESQVTQAIWNGPALNTESDTAPDHGLCTDIPNILGSNVEAGFQQV